MSVLEIKYLENSVSYVELDYIKKHIPKRYSASLSYKSEESRNLTLLGGIMIYNNLHVDEDSIKYNKLKKPYIENGPFFNVSHSKDMVVFVKSENKIGIDIEAIDKKNISIIDYAFSKDEKEYIINGKDKYTDAERLIKLWTIKESLFKASGSEKYIEPKNINAYGENNVITILENICFENDKCVETNSSAINLELATIDFLDETYNVYSFKWLKYFVSVASIIRYDNINLVKG